MNKRLRTALDRELDDYRQRLATHDWAFEMSEDPNKWAAGNKEHKELVSMQQRLDPDRKIWKQFAR